MPYYRPPSGLVGPATTSSLGGVRLYVSSSSSSSPVVLNLDATGSLSIPNVLSASQVVAASGTFGNLIASVSGTSITGTFGKFTELSASQLTASSGVVNGNLALVGVLSGTSVTIVDLTASAAISASRGLFAALTSSGPLSGTSANFTSLTATGPISGTAGQFTSLTSTGIISGTNLTVPSISVTGGSMFVGNGFGDPNSESAFRLKFFDNGGTYNDPGIGLSGSGGGGETIWFNALGGFKFNYGTGGYKIVFNDSGGATFSSTVSVGGTAVSLVDHNHNGTYVRTGVADTISAAHNFNSTGITFSGHQFRNMYSTNQTYDHFYPSGGNGANWSGANLRVWNGAGSYKCLYFDGQGNFQWDGNNVWTAANLSVSTNGGSGHVLQRDASSRTYALGFSVATGLSDLADSAPWYGVGMTNVTESSGWRVGLHGYYGLQLKTASGLFHIPSDGSAPSHNGTAVSLSGHTHDYAASGHNHDSVYAKLSGATFTGDVYANGWITTPHLFINRAGDGSSGIQWYSQGYKAWVNYMSPTGAGMGPNGNITAPSGTYVSSWALRSFIEDAGGYGWTWEAGSSQGDPSIVAELRSENGNFWTKGLVHAERYLGRNTLVLASYATVSPSSNVYLYSPGGDRDAWIYLDSADLSSNWGIYHRQIDSAVSGLPANSIGFIGGGNSALKAYICLTDGSANFVGALTQAGNQVWHSGNLTNDSYHVKKWWRNDSDNYYLTNTWDGAYWYLYGYYQDGSSHAGVRVNYANNADTVDNLHAVQLFNNMGRNHTDTTDFNAVDTFGFRFVQATTNGPGTGSGQFYGFTIGLGNDYAVTSYALQLAIPRYHADDKYITMRVREGGTWNAWQKISAGYADSAGNSTTTSQRTFSGDVWADQFYTNGWFRTNGDKTGLYSSNHANHFYADSNSAWNIGATSGAYPQLLFRTEHNGTIRGRIYSDADGFGLLNNTGSWAVRIPYNSTTVYMGVVVATELNCYNGSINAGDKIYLGSQNTVSTTAFRGINWHTDSDLNYYIGKPAGDWAKPLHIAFYTGIKYGAEVSYGGHKFYGSSGMTSELFTIGNGDSHVRVANNLYVGAVLTTGGISLNGSYPAQITHGSTRYLLQIRRTNAAGSGYWFAHDDNTMVVHFDGIADRMWLTSAGALSVSSTITGTDVTATSDERLKTNIQPIVDLWHRIGWLSGITFNRKDRKTGEISNRRSIGLSAQRVQEVFPEAVEIDNENYLSVNYGGLVGGIAFDALNDLNDRVKKQEREIDGLKDLVRKLSAKLGIDL